MKKQFFSKDNSIDSIDICTASRCKNKNGMQRWLCVYNNNILPESPYIWNNDYHVQIDDAAGRAYLRKEKGRQLVIDGEDYEVIEIIPIDAYFFRVSVAKMIQLGAAKEIVIPSNGGKLDLMALNEWILSNISDEGSTIKWLEQYNNIQDIPMPLYVYKRFTRFTYLQFVYMMLDTPEIFIREIRVASKQTDKYIISFSALIALFKAGITADVIKKSGGAIMQSTLLQVGLDSSEIISENDKDIISSLCVIDGQISFKSASDEEKEYWLKEAGTFKKFCEAIPAVNSDIDLAGSFFGGFDSKDIFGICDYDAISYVQQNDEYSLVSVEALLSSLSINDQVLLRVSSIADWLVQQEFDAIELIVYITRLMEEGCLLSVTESVIKYISHRASQVDDSLRQNVYSEWIQLFEKINRFPEKQRKIVNSELKNIITSENDELINYDRVIIQTIKAFLGED